MKTNYPKIAIQIFAILLAIGSSFATTASEKKVNAPVTGYFPKFPIIGPPPIAQCMFAQLCSNTPGPICTGVYQGITYQVFGKANPNDTVCQIVLFKQQ